jgi:hypothetical protein
MIWLSEVSIPIFCIQLKKELLKAYRLKVHKFFGPLRNKEGLKKSYLENGNGIIIQSYKLRLIQ